MNNKTLLIGINLVDFGSTGSMMRNSFEYALNKSGKFDYLVIVPYSLNDKKTYCYCSKFKFVYKTISYITRKLRLSITDIIFTKKIIKKINVERKKYSSCIIHIHNIHSCHINFQMLMEALSKIDVKIVYTLHDSWALTGGCFYWNFVKCFKWKNGCKNNCIQNYPNCNHIWNIKRKCFNDIKDKLIFVCVSKWVKNQLSFSYLKDFKSVTNLGECSIRPLDHPDIELKSKLGLTNKKIAIIVSSYWNDWKGTKYIYEIADKLPNNYVILVIGGKFNTKKQQNIIHISEIKNEKINSYYSISDVCISTSQDESLGLTTCEAQICGVPVIAFGHSGVKETISKKSGFIIGDNNTDLFVQKIIEVCENNPFKKDDIINNGRRFSKGNHSKRIFDLYNNLVNSK